MTNTPSFHVLKNKPIKYKTKYIHKNKGNNRLQITKINKNITKKSGIKIT